MLMQLQRSRASLLRGSKNLRPPPTSVPMSYSVFNALRGLTSPSQRVHATSQTVDQGNELGEWITSQGGHCQYIQVAKDGVNGQTLMADRHVKKGQTLVSLPRQCQLHAESSDPGWQALIDKVPSQLWAARLALPLIAERLKGSESRFNSYLRSLPAGIAGLPIFFRPDEIAQLQYPPLVHQINIRCRWLLKFASEEMAQSSLPGATKVDANLLGWGMGCASSRAFKVGAQSQPSMLPMIDLCNHSFTPNCKLQGTMDGGAHLVAAQDIPKDTALEINYGNLPNSVLLQDYGFVMRNNPHDAIDMAVSPQQIQVAQVLGGVSIPTEPLPWQQKLLDNLGMGQGASAQLKVSGDVFDWHLVAAVRILCADKEQDLKFKTFEQLGAFNKSQSQDIERKSLLTLAAMCAQLIAAMGTKLEEDKQIIQQEGLSANTQLAIRFRMGLKLLTQAALALCLNKVKTLAN